jgi:ribosomal protein S18 acetylase RimI-like enzyme
MSQATSNLELRAAIALRPAVAADVPEMVKIHRNAFEGFFLTKLGPKFLRELYTAFLSSADAVDWVATDGGTVVGFVVGTCRPKGFFKRLLFRRGARFLLYATEAFVRNPWQVGRRLAAAVVYRGDFPAEVAGTGALLSSIAVDPGHKCRGIGKLLVEAFAADAFVRGAQFIYLITDQVNNDSVHNFYRQTGFLSESTLIKPGGRMMTRYVRTQRIVGASEGAQR